MNRNTADEFTALENANEQLQRRAEAAEARAAQNDALMTDATTLIAELRNERDTLRAALSREEYKRMVAEAERDAAQGELQQIRAMLDDGGNGVSNSVLEMVKRLQAALDAARHEAWIERM